MTQRLSKKGKNPGAVDNWLEALGFYRKNVAYDETCLFRSISEQLFDIQIYHERVRTDCINYARKYSQEFLHLVESEDKLLDHLSKLEKHMVICGNLEIQIISKTYQCDITLFDAAFHKIDYVVQEGNTNLIMLCLLNEDHYDAVYKRDHIIAAGFCQSIVYKILYENVFEIADVDQIVQGMLYDKTYITTPSEIVSEGHEDQNDEKTPKESKDVEVFNFPLNIAPFPFKVAKALDHSIYRNIEYDAWTEVRREMRLGDWYYGDDKLILGTRCVFNDEVNKEFHDCYIQDILKNENKCVIYITKLAQKKIVNYSELSPENDAKPWPLPYRFSKNLNISSPTTILPLDKIKARRRKDKNRNKSESSNYSNGHNVTENQDQNVSAFVGAPLQMQNAQERQSPVNEVTEEVQDFQPQCDNSPRYQWDIPYFSYPNMMPSSMPVTPVIADSFSWPPTPVSPGVFNFNVRPVMTPVATTPNYYCEVNQTPAFNQPVEQFCSYQQQQSWTHVDPQMAQQHSQVLDYNHNNKEAVNCQKLENNESHYCSSREAIPNNPVMVEAQPLVCTSVPRVNPHLPLYSPIIPVQPGTPVIYSPPAEIVVPTTPVQMYSHPVDAPYSPYIMQEPATNNVWYSVGVNAQGFIFPTSNIQTVPKPQ